MFTRLQSALRCVQRYQRLYPSRMTSIPAPIFSYSPAESRREFQTNSSLFGTPSASYSLGCLQANVAILPSQYADDFSEFCRLNKAPCPVLYRSKPGELDTPLSRGSDIRTDVTTYLVTKCDKSGEFITAKASHLTDYPFDDMVTFYIGCSFTFDSALMESGIPVPHVIKQNNVPMYKINVKCNPVGPFSCDQMIVSMRPVKKDDIEKAVSITARYDEVHGAPIHLGNPELIGIKDVYNPDAGDKPEIADNEVPLFWGCGVTTSHAIKTAKPKICMSHSPGCMFICDVKEKDFFKDHPPPHGDEEPKVITLQDEPFYASVLGEKALSKITKLEEMMQDDPGNRGIVHLHQPGQLVKAALRVSHGNSIAIVTGFPLKNDKDEFCNETDGPLGALMMAKAFTVLGKNVTLISSHYNVNMLNHIVSECMNLKILPQGITVEEFSPEGTKIVEDAAVDFLYPGGNVKKPRFDVLVAIEAVGRNDDGKYKSMSDVCVTDFKKTSPVDELFIQALQKGGISTIGIGDGGNEIGMGNVKELVKQHIKNGDRIACDVGVNHLLTSGVSNWGGWALATSVFLLNNCLFHSRYQRYGIGLHCDLKKEDVLSSFKQEEKVLELLLSHGTIDGLKGKVCMSVDGFDFGDVHKSKLDQMYSVL